jgi:hypothetical protein
MADSGCKRIGAPNTIVLSHRASILEVEDVFARNESGVKRLPRHCNLEGDLLQQTESPNSEFSLRF